MGVSQLRQELGGSEGEVECSRRGSMGKGPVA